MSNKKAVVKGGGGAICRIKEGSRLMRAHESMVDFINGRSVLNVFTSGLFGLDFIRSLEGSLEGSLEDDLIYSDEDEDEGTDRLCPHHVSRKPVEPHPRIKQLTAEEADRHARELIEEEERGKQKTEKNRHKKMKKKEKKRKEKENAEKEIEPEEEPEEEESVSSENQEEKTIIEKNEIPQSGKIEDAKESAPGSDEKIADIKEEKLDVKIKEDDEELKKLNLNNSSAPASKSEPQETAAQKPAKKKKKKEKSPKAKEKKPKVAKVENQKIKSDPEPREETSPNPTLEEYAKRSRELAGVGNRLAASGQYEMAVKYFTDAIKHNPKEYKLFGNRSLCYERINQCENALRDADLALCMEPNWIKGLFRKGKALCGLKKYYEASLVYKEVLRLESTSAEAVQELKRAQTLHLMEMGFSWAQSAEALKTHGTLEEAVDALFASGHNAASSSRENNNNSPVQMQVEDQAAGTWTTSHATRPRMQQVKESDAAAKTRSKSQSPTPSSSKNHNHTKPGQFSIWVGSLSPTVTYTTLHEVFSRAGAVQGIKMLLEQQCAFINYSKKEECDKAIQCINGLVVEGAPLSVRYPNRAIQAGLVPSKSTKADPFQRPGPYKKECFFWRTTGCTRGDCTFRHVPDNKHIDKDKFTSRMGNFQ